jgi:hypothetical protein
VSAPILRRGDRIHLAFPALPGDSEASGRQVARDAVVLTDMYAKVGVHVEIWSANSALSHPTVVAVFRDDEEVEK